MYLYFCEWHCHEPYSSWHSFPTFTFPHFLQIKRVNPEKVCYLEYDKLYVDHKIYVWNETLGQVIEHAEAERYGYGGINDFMMSRPGNVYSDPEKCFELFGS